MSPTSLSRPIIEKGCIYNLSFFLCVCVWSMGAIFQTLSPRVTLKMGPRSLNLISSCPCLNNIAVLLVKIHPFILETGCKKAIFQQSEPSCGLENGVTVTKI